MNKNKQNSDLIKEKLYKILPLERNERLKEILHLLNLTNKEEVEISKNKIFDAIISIPKEGQAPKIPIFGIITLENSDPENIKKIRKFLWNKNDIPLSLIITPTDIILNNNYNIKETKGFLNSLKEDGRFPFYLLTYDNLINGKCVEECAKVLKTSDRVDQSLLKNIQKALSLMCNKGTSFQKAHNLMSKSIFIKYLEDRNIITSKTFYKFEANSYIELLSSKSNINFFFEYLERKFGGNIFYSESDEILKDYEIEILSHFLQGDDLETGQQRLWGYDFSIIPIELISNIYELFLIEEDFIGKRKHGAFYTPYSLVNAMVENVFSRISEKNCKVLDPACGSGVFLVSCFKKIVSLSQTRVPSDLISLLKNNIFGVDINAQALKITKFSLYIALLDCFEPKDIEENNIQLPNLSKNLYLKDYFDENLLRNVKFDLIIGNPPWTSVPTKACAKYNKKRYPGVVSDSQLCQSFILRTIDFLSKNGVASMLVSNGIFYNSNATNFRKFMFKNLSLIEILNLQKLRGKLFLNAKYPCSAVTFKCKGNESLCDYINVNKNFFDTIQNKITFDKSNSQKIAISVIDNYDYIWRILHEGSVLDFELITSIKENNTSLIDYLRKYHLNISQGCSAGKEIDTSFIKMKEATGDYFTSFTIDYKHLPQNNLQSFERIHDKEQYYSKNRLLIKRTIRNKHPECAFTDCALFYKNDFYSIYTNKQINSELYFLEGILNSDFYNYYQFHMASSYNKTSKPEIRMNDIKEFPLPNYSTETYNKIVNIVKNIHAITKDYSLNQTNSTDYQLSMFNKHYKPNRKCDLLERLLLQLNKTINESYGFGDKELSIINYTLNYFLQAKNYCGIKDSSKEYYNTLCLLLKNFIPKDYHIFNTTKNGKFFDLLFFEFTKNTTKIDLEEIINLILNIYEISSINELCNKIAFRKNFIGIFPDGLFIIKDKRQENRQKAIAYLDFKKIQKLLLTGGEK